MPFNSYAFIFIFLPIVLSVYFILTKYKLVTIAKVWLVFASLFFYGFFNYKYLLLLTPSILMNYFCAKSFNISYFNKSQKKIILISGIAINLILLGYFKYANFFIGNINSVFHLNIALLNIAIPLATSFFTFQQMGYVFDSYNKVTEPVGVLDYFYFVTFFPQLLAGPIVRYCETMPQILALRTKVFNYKNIMLGIFLFTIGLFKKTILADQLATFVAFGYNPHTQLSTIEAWLVSLSYTFQIYFDFSGYIDMATGVAKMFNIKLPINFDSPYKSMTIAEFWRRWHITLSSWFRDYLFYPLMRTDFCNKLRNFGSKFLPKYYAQNLPVVWTLLVVWFLIGLWHGASWNFVLHGLYYGTLIILGILFAPQSKKLVEKFKIDVDSFAFRFFKISWTFLLVTLGNCLFRATSLSDTRKILAAMFGFNGLLYPNIKHLDFYFTPMNLPAHEYPNIILYLALSFIFVFACKNSNQIIEMIKIKSKKSAVIYSVVFALIFVICLLKMLMVPYKEFIYFNF